MLKYIYFMALAFMANISVAQDMPEQHEYSLNKQACSYVYKYAERIGDYYKRVEPSNPSAFVEMTFKLHLDKYGPNEEVDQTRNERIALLYIKEQSNVLYTDVDRYTKMSLADKRISPLVMAASNLFDSCMASNSFEVTSFTTDVLKGVKEPSYKEKADRLKELYEKPSKTTNVVWRL